MATNAAQHVMPISYAGEARSATGMEGSEASPASVGLRYLGLLVVTFASAVAISGFAPADVVAAVGL